ncbi:Pleiotropic drug resistance protein 1 [Glycine soja]|nr:Pleiotropic drug resistance protein 1 [Glycine soja]
MWSRYHGRDSATIFDISPSTKEICKTCAATLALHNPPAIFDSTQNAWEVNVIDVQELGLQEKRALLERLVKTAEENNEKFLLKLKGRIDRVGIDLPTIEVWFENLNIEAEARVGTRALPTFTNFMVNIEECAKQNIAQSKMTVTQCAKPMTRGMVLPFEPHFITFDDVTYSVDMPVYEMRNRGVVEDKLVLLKGVSGAFRPGVLTALMGVTGAGKTTLMDVLAGRKTGGYIGGNITISGYPKKQETFARISGYCEQNDIHSPHVTVYESLLYSAWLRLSPEINAQSRKMFIEEVMELVELKPLRHALVGLPAIVMRTVRNTVDTGRTVVCTIHQPSIDIFESFDELLLMKQGGQEIYVGPLGHHSSHLISYFEGIKGVNRIKDGYNPATWMLEVSTSAKEMELGVDFAEVYKNSELYRRNKALIKELSTPAPGSKDLYFPSQYSTSFLTQCMACLWKQHWSYWRNPLYTAIRFLYSTAVAAVLGSMFWNLGSKIDKQQDLFNAMGSMYAAVLLIGIKNANAVQPVVAVERTVFYREKAAGMYSALPYAFAQASKSSF